MKETYERNLWNRHKRATSKKNELSVRRLERGKNALERHTHTDTHRHTQTHTAPLCITTRKRPITNERDQ